MKIAIIGKMCSGKTTISSIIQDYDNSYKRIGFGDKVKCYARDLFNMQGKDRTLLTTFATKMREIDPDVWVNAALRNIDGDNYIIDDVRYQNELDALTKDNWIIIKLNISDELQIERIKKTYPNNYLDHLKNRDHISERNELLFKSGYPHLTICVDNLDINKLQKMIIDFLTKCIIDDV
jgi:hypothetical protein